MGRVRTAREHVAHARKTQNGRALIYPTVKMQILLPVGSRR
jgi:hypothetical protein